jgi:hypothetical protein
MRLLENYSGQQWLKIQALARQSPDSFIFLRRETRAWPLHAVIDF